MQRYLANPLRHDLNHKVVLLTGPRQCGKTELSKLLSPHFDYLNFDAEEDRLILKDKSWDRRKPLIIFDELHKMPDWKRWLKGIYDTEGVKPQLLVTGSARLDTYQKVGDSLAGRFFQYRLHPLDVKEACQYHTDKSPEQCFNALYQLSGFPEPFLNGRKTFYKRWQRTHSQIILREDLLDLYPVRDIKSIETLALLLKQRTGSTTAYASLAGDLARDINTIKRWLTLLENLYLIFRVTPYSHNIARAILKEPKFYFYDVANLPDTEGVRLENIVAAALLKQLQFLEDTKGIETRLHFLRTKDGQEIDFLITQDQQPTHMIEVKTSDDKPSTAFDYFAKFHPNVKKIQLVKNLKREKTYPNGVQVLSLIPWLAQVDLS